MKGQAAVWVELDETTADLNGTTDFGWNVFGWSGGYVAFDQFDTAVGDGSVMVTKTSHSTDGIHWKAGPDFEPDYDAGGFTGYTGVLGVSEGPAGLLAFSGKGSDCGWDSEKWPVAMSRDGVTWEPVNTHSDDETDNRNLTLGENVDGGAGGYIIAGAQGSFTSADGMSWKRVDLTSPAFAGMEGIEGGTSFSGGFVLSGEATVPSKGCDGPDLNQLVPSVWWSPNGSTWTREVLPNATDGQGADTYVCHFGDHLLIAGEVTSDYTLHEWKSADGRTWSPLPISGPILCPHSDSAFNDPAIVSAATVSSVGDRTLAISSDEIWAVNDNGTVKKLSQTGKLPAGGIGPVIFGPAGLIVPGNDGNTYVGVPVAG